MSSIKPIAPMLAVPMSKADIRDWNDYIAEEKWDGWRFVVTVPACGAIVAHTRERKHAGGGPKDQNDASDLLTPDVLRDLERLRPRTGFLTLDGEYLAIHPDGRVGTSTDVPRKDLTDKRYMVFDILTDASGSCVMLTYAQRRDLLATKFNCAGRTFQHVLLPEVRPCVDSDTVANYTHEVWNRGGEGLILKLKTARYEPGKRRAAFVKVKNLFSAVIKVTGFEATRGTVMNRGAFATVLGTIVEAPEGHKALIGRQTSVKTKNDRELVAFNKQAANIEGTLDHVLRTHPALGRLLRIEYQDVAADGGVRHPRWDRWEDE